ncbi:hypothetical protein WICMUC_005320, partial [Wickerhamomyces mucosus]
QLENRKTQLEKYLDGEEDYVEKFELEIEDKKVMNSSDNSMVIKDVPTNVSSVRSDLSSSSLDSSAVVTAPLAEENEVD